MFKIARRAQRLTSGAVFLLVFSTPEVKRLIIELNTEGQLRFGKLSDGSTLPDYSRISQDLFDKPDGPIQLFDTGDFYDSFTIQSVTKEFIQISADPIKGDTNLFERYGIDVLGLTDENIEVLNEMVIPRIIEYVKTELLQDL